MSIVNPRVSVIILTRNSAKTIKSVLDGVMKQNFNDYELLLIDTSSTDETLKIAKAYPCRIITINSDDFGHGRTRNYAARIARGEFIVYLTHDSVPESNNWLSELIKPFDDINVVGVYGRQIPRKNENVLDKHFQLSLYGDRAIVWKIDNWCQGDNLFSDANSAVRKQVLLKYPYLNNIIVSEDYEWAAGVLKLGFNIVYTPTASVIHSHSYNIYSLFKRNFDVGVSYKVIYTSKRNYMFMVNSLGIVKQEIKFLRKTGNAILIPRALFRDLIRFIAIQFGKREQVFSKKLKRDHLSAQKWYWE
jgi:rhamnosyltransferase